MIEAAQSEAQIADVRNLLREYADRLGIDLSFQNFEQEVATLPGAYAPPRGALLLAMERDEAIGCVAMRPLAEGVCEMKRLYVRPTARGGGWGSRLVEAIENAARQAGYRAIRLDTLPTMDRATWVYRKRGYRDIDPYCANPIPGTLFLEKSLV